jgi:hypothetical protein
MSDHRSPPPEAAACLERRRESSQKGGTIIAEDVTDAETHRRRLCDPDGYRPETCPSCQHDVLHVHGYRERMLVADPVMPMVTVIVYLCMGCGGTWRILPRFVARHLWRSWRTVEASTVASPPLASQPKVAERTVRRWRERLASSARTLLQILATSGSAWLETMAQALGLDATRGELVAHYGPATLPKPASPVSQLAALIHRLEPGVRLM